MTLEKSPRCIVTAFTGALEQVRGIVTCRFPSEHAYSSTENEEWPASHLQKRPRHEVRVVISFHRCQSNRPSLFSSRLTEKSPQSGYWRAENGGRSFAEVGRRRQRRGESLLRTTARITERCAENTAREFENSRLFARKMR